MDATPFVQLLFWQGDVKNNLHENNIIGIWPIKRLFHFYDTIEIIADLHNPIRENFAKRALSCII